MATDVLLVREGNTLAPRDPISMEAVQEIAIGETVAATLRRPRNPRHHRLFMAMVDLVFKNQERYATKKQLLDAIKIRCGYYDAHTLDIAGMPVTVCVPKSIAFASMAQDEFNQFYEKAVMFIIEHVLPGIGREDLETEVLSMVGN